MSLKFNDLEFWFNEKKILWEEVETIYSYKIDLVVYDEIILEISTRRKNLNWKVLNGIFRWCIRHFRKTERYFLREKMKTIKKI